MKRTESCGAARGVSHSFELSERRTKERADLHRGFSSTLHDVHLCCSCLPKPLPLCEAKSLQYIVLVTAFSEVLKFLLFAYTARAKEDE